jgi:hypothetical protein
MNSLAGAGVGPKTLNTSIANLGGIASQAENNMGTLNQQSQAAGQGATQGYQNLAQNGLPFYRNTTDYSSGMNAQAFAPQRAALLRQTNQYANMPSGYRDAMLTSLAAQEGRSFDNSNIQNALMNQQAKAQGLAGLQGEQQIAGNEALGYGALGAGANQAIMQGPRKPGMLGAIGGAMNNVMNTAFSQPRAAQV